MISNNTNTEWKSDSQVRRENALPRNARGYFHCPDCKYKNKSPAGLSAHRRKEHGYVSPFADKHKADRQKKNKGKLDGRKRRGGIVLPGPNPAYWDSERKKLINVNGLFHCPENCGYTHTHATSMGWHRRKAHGIGGINAHRPKKPREAISMAEFVQQEKQRTTAPTVVYAGCNNCPNCGHDMRGHNQVALLSQRTLDTGEPYKLTMSFSAKHDS